MSKPLSQAMRILMRCDLGAPRLAREAVRKLDAAAPVRDDALLVASELVSNAVLHAGCDPGDTIEMVAEVDAAAIRITVLDPGRSGGTPKPSDGAITSIGGMGLRLVQMLARRWGVERDHPRRVWAELAV